MRDIPINALIIMFGLFLNYVHESCQCHRNEFECANGQCVQWSKRCDGHDDCGDDSDEFCPPHTACARSKFQCNNGKCIPWSYKCDGDNDCGDYSDEGCHYHSGCQGNRFSCTIMPYCIPWSHRCDGRDDCGDSSDETCPAHTPCDNNKFKCTNGKCISYSDKCDGTDDCGDGSDEVCHAYCSYRCNNGKSFCSWDECDGKNDCGDFTDEDSCRSCKRSDQFKCGTKCILSALVCDGYSDCPYGEDEAGCTCADQTQFKCGNGACINGDLICDDKKDCTDGSDERDCLEKGDRYPYGPSGMYDCNCVGHCHPVTGACYGSCKNGWRGPTCQIENVNFQSPKQQNGRLDSNSPKSVDGDLFSCPTVAYGTPSTWWEVNIARSVYLKRMRIYNKQDTTHLGYLVDTFARSCTWNDNFAEVGYMDVACDVNVPTNRVRFTVNDTNGQMSTLQICEFQIIVCSNNSFGVQCEKTCNCLSDSSCDDITGACKTGCKSGWTGTSCDVSATAVESNKDGLEAWAIAVITVAAVLVTSVAAFIIVKVVKAKKRVDPLRTNEGEIKNTPPVWSTYNGQHTACAVVKQDI